MMDYLSENEFKVASKLILEGVSMEQVLQSPITIEILIIDQTQRLPELI